MKKLTVVILVMIGFTLAFTGCKKYEDGPMCSLRSKKARVVGIWIIDKYFVNGTEIPNTGTGTEVETEFSKDKKFQVRFGSTIVDNGTWDFGTKKETLEEQSEGESTKEVRTILRLKEKEMWLQEIDGGNTYETHYKAK